MLDYSVQVSDSREVMGRILEVKPDRILLASRSAVSDPVPSECLRLQALEALAGI